VFYVELYNFYLRSLYCHGCVARKLGLVTVGGGRVC
jgi:hypothetical protein